jgi:hypothetical protein
MTPYHTRIPRTVDGCPGFGRRWLAATLSCSICDRSAVHVFPCKFIRDSRPILPCPYCGSRTLYPIDDEPLPRY